jgi:hypothetical protein
MLRAQKLADGPPKTTFTAGRVFLMLRAKATESA